MACDSDTSGLNAEMIAYEKIWPGNAHCAFTSLVEYDGKYYCAFREAASHVANSSEDFGGIRILVSDNGREWKPFTLLIDENFDLRDPKLSVSSDYQLVLTHGCTNTSLINFPKTRVKFFYSEELEYRFINENDYFSISIEDDEILSNYWIWRTTWHERKAYGVAYKNGKKPLFVTSTDGIRYRLICELDALGNEADIDFKNDGSMIIAMRSQNGPGFIGYSTPPYT